MGLIQSINEFFFIFNNLIVIIMGEGDLMFPYKGKHIMPIEITLFTAKIKAFDDHPSLK